MTADTDTSEATDPQPDPVPAPAADPLAELRAEVAVLSRRLAVNDEEIDVLQVESARQSRKWHRDPTVLTAVLAVMISVGSTFLSQYNLNSDREVQTRARLTSLIQQLPAAQQALRENPQSGGIDGLLLVAGDASELMSEVESSSFEKIEVAAALQLAGDFGRATTLARKGVDESSGFLDSLFATRLLARLNFQTNNSDGGRANYREVLDQLSRPTPTADSPLTRTSQTWFTDILWAEDEATWAVDCVAARQRLRDADEIYPPAGLPGPTKTARNNLTALITDRCPS